MCPLLFVTVLQHTAACRTLVRWKSVLAAGKELAEEAAGKFLKIFNIGGVGSFWLLCTTATGLRWGLFDDCSC